MKKPKFLSTELSANGFGFIRLAEHICSGAPIPHPLRHICGLMRDHNCDLLVVEELENGMDSAEESQLLLHVLGRRTLTRSVFRLSFYRSTQQEEPVEFGVFATDFLLPPNEEQEAVFRQLFATGALDCLGLIYVYRDQDGEGYPLGAYVPSGFIRPLDTNLTSHYVHSKAIFEEGILPDKSVDKETIKVQVEGSYFAQQQGILSCCGHAAIMVALKNIFTAVGTACPISLCGYKDMNELLGIDHQTRHAERGITPLEIARLFERAGIATEIFSQDCISEEVSVEDVISTAYYAIETGLPAIICFNGGDSYHAMTVVGHTFNQCRWSAKAVDAYFHERIRPYKASHEWVDELIVQDDNFGPYCTLFLQELRTKNPIVIVPRFSWSTVVSPSIIETRAAWYLVARCWDNNRNSLLQSIIAEGRSGDAANNFWFHKLVEHVASLDFVLRTTPTTKKQYLDWLLPLVQEDLEDSHLVDIIQSLGPTDSHPCWLVEISIPELYQHNKRRIGEILIREIEGGDGQTLLWPCLIRLPGTLTANFDFADRNHYEVSPRYHYEIASRDPNMLAGIRVL